MKNDLISVLMPVYNVEPYVGESIESVLNQTYPNFEFIIVDDCSTDRTFNICKEYAAKDSRIKLFKNEVNLRIEKTLNFALSKSNGKYIIRQDGDDISAPERFGIMKNFLDCHKDIALCGTNTLTVDANGAEIGRSTFPSSQRAIMKTLTIRNPVLHIWMTYKSVYDDLGGYRIFFGSEDYDFVLRLVSRGYKVTNIPNYFGYSVRVNRENNTVSIYGLSRILSSDYAVKMYKERLRKSADSYTEGNIQNFIKTRPLQEKLFSSSNRHLYTAMNFRRNGNAPAFIFHVLLSCVSPHQVRYYCRRIKYNLIANKYKDRSK